MYGQVSSGRFGVTPQYLMAADQLEIKIAQGIYMYIYMYTYI